MNEKEKYLNLYGAAQGEKSQVDIIPGHMGGGYGRICWGENMLETLKRWKIASLLDVGCGYGNFCDAAALFVPRVYGLDIASVATGNVIDNPEITYLDGEAKQLPLPDNAVEWITSFDCLEHCLEQDIDRILREFDRVSTKGFVLSISYTPCEAEGLPLHMTVQPESWWIRKLSQYGQVSKEGKAPITGAPYLICRKPIEKTLLCYCAGSIGTRLRAMALADRLARQTGRHLNLVWLRDDPLCRSSFSSLFINPIPRISEEEMLDLPSCKIYAHIKEVADQALISGGNALRTAVQKWGAFEFDAFSVDDPEDHIILFAPKSKIDLRGDEGDGILSHLRPTASVEQRIRELMERLVIDKDVIGVHARGTDFGIQADAYAHQMQKAINQNADQKFLVCSDDRSYEHSLESTFPGHVTIRPKSAWSQKRNAKLPWALGNVETSDASVVDALIDLYLLAHTRFEIYHESSAYAQTGVLLSQCLEMGRKNKWAARHNGIHGHDKKLQDTDVRDVGNHVAVKTRHTIYYYCPQMPIPSAGIRRLHRHVSILHAAGLPVYLMFEKQGYRHPNLPGVPVVEMDHAANDETAIFVIPEGMPRIMHQLKDHPGRRFAIALSWCYVYGTLPDGLDWRHLNIERVLTVSPTIGRMINWSMGLPVHLLDSSIDHQRYYVAPEPKQKQIAFIQRKGEHSLKLQSLLASRNQDYINKIRWVGLDGLHQEAYAAQIRASAIFLSTSMAEGFPTSCLEAMAAGTLVCGYDGIGSKDILRSEGQRPNGLIADNGDYAALAYRMAPLLDDLIQDRMDRWAPIISNARRTASKYTAANEAASVIAFWKPFICDEPAHQQENRTNSQNMSVPFRPMMQQEGLLQESGYS